MAAFVVNVCHTFASQAIVKYYIVMEVISVLKRAYCMNALHTKRGARTATLQEIYT